MAGLLLSGAPAAAASPQYIDHTQWAKWNGKSSLRVFPTAVGRQTSRPSAVAQGAVAWSQVLADAPDADTPGMREQFMCHWYFAEMAGPGKSSWNLEPWRPVVDDATMLQSGCNPGGAEEKF